MALYSERGFEQTTVADIATRAGLAERTFFRHFADKREVLFGGSKTLEEALVQQVAGAPAHLAPMDAVAAAFEGIAFFTQERRAHSRQRQRIIAANAELQERELIKLAWLSAALAGVLRGRGVPDPAAGLTADAGMAVFKAAFDRWTDETNRQDFGPLVRAALGELRAVIADPSRF